MVRRGALNHKQTQGERNVEFSLASKLWNEHLVCFAQVLAILDFRFCHSDLVYSYGKNGRQGGGLVSRARLGSSVRLRSETSQVGLAE
jgi:hypothetical protein